MVYPRINSTKSATTHLLIQIMEDNEIKIEYLTLDNYAETVGKLIRDAQKSIHITIFSANTKKKAGKGGRLSIFDHLEVAGQRGLNCRIVLAEVHPFKYRAHFNAHAIDRLIKANWIIRTMKCGHLLHQKQIIIDQEVVIIGSHNISSASEESNRDVSVKIISKNIVISAMNEFNKCYKMSR